MQLKTPMGTPGGGTRQCLSLWRGEQSPGHSQPWLVLDPMAPAECGGMQPPKIPRSFCIPTISHDTPKSPKPVSSPNLYPLPTTCPLQTPCPQSYIPSKPCVPTKSRIPYKSHVPSKSCVPFGPHATHPVGTAGDPGTSSLPWCCQHLDNITKVRKSLPPSHSSSPQETPSSGEAMND